MMIGLIACNTEWDGTDTFSEAICEHNINLEAWDCATNAWWTATAVKIFCFSLSYEIKKKNLNNFSLNLATAWTLGNCDGHFFTVLWRKYLIDWSRKCQEDCTTYSRCLVWVYKCQVPDVPSVAVNVQGFVLSGLIHSALQLSWGQTFEQQVPPVYSNVNNLLVIIMG